MNRNASAGWLVRSLVACAMWWLVAPSGCAEVDLNGDRAQELAGDGDGGDDAGDDASRTSGDGGGGSGGADGGDHRDGSREGSGGGGGGGGGGGCVDYATAVSTILNTRCTKCHKGSSPPQGLNLETYAGVLKGGKTGNEVIACQPRSSLLYMKVSMSTPPVGIRMPADGPPYLPQSDIDTIQTWIQTGARQTCAEPDPCSDTTPPTFAGLSSAVLSASKLGADVCWPAAKDDVTPAAGIVVDVYQGTVPGGEVFTGPATATSAAGATCMNLEGLTPGQEYCFVARARDAAGNRDANTVEKCVTVPAASCIDFESMVKPIFGARCTKCHSGPTPPQGLHLDSYAGVMAGGLTGNEVVSCQSGSSLLYKKISMASPPVGIRMPADGPPYLTDVQIGTIQRWVDEGARPSCAAPDPCSNTTPPTFGGVTSATAVSATAAKLCWNPATDDVTPASGIVYDVFEGPTPGAETFATPSASSAAGATCVELDARSPQTQYCWVVRARDSAGNRDANVVEKCLTMPAVAAGCVDYDTMIAPLFRKNCVRCHSDPTPPQWLRLTSYEGVIAGGVRRNEVVACNPAASLLMSKVSPTPSVGKRMPYDGPPYLSAPQIAMLSQWISNGATRSCSVPAACGDTTAPSFGGATSASAVDATTLRVCWDPATDAGTQPPDMKYDVYEAASSGAQTYTLPPQKTVVGQTCANVTVGPGANMCFVVRARDLANNRDTNGVERCASALPNACAVEYDAHVRPILSARCAHCHSGPSPGHFLRLTSYPDVLVGGSLRSEVKGCDWAGSLLHQKTSAAVCGKRMPRDGAPWLAPSEDSVLSAWVTSGARHACSDAPTCGDTTPPAFGGAASAQATGPDRARVCWNAATDNATKADAITYLVYESATPGGESFGAPASYAASGGQTCIDVPTPFSATSCYVVRARDLTFNTDTNSVEVCTTTPPGCFDYGAEIQPLFDARCVHCHGGSNPPKGISWESYTKATTTGGLDKILEMVETCQMPRDTTGQCGVKACLTPSQKRLLRQWTTGGARQFCPW